MKSAFPALETYLPLIQFAKSEDLGAASDDVTSRLAIDESITGVGTLVQKQPGVICGLPMVQPICDAYDPRLRVQMLPGLTIDSIEGRYTDAKVTPILNIAGPLRSLLSVERVILNFLQHLSGVATMTHQFVKAVEGTGAQIVDTRKTLPGFRSLDKYAVLAGGAKNHRTGLYDMVLLKDNHLAAYPIRELRKALSQIVRQSRNESPTRPIEVEVDTLEQLSQVLQVEEIDYVLLDNMDCQTLKQAVAMRNAARNDRKPMMEASGGVNLQTVRDIAETGVERISVGAITHSAPALDIGLDVRGIDEVTSIRSDSVHESG